VVWGFRDGSPSVTQSMVRSLLEDAMRAACRDVWNKAQEDPNMRGMGTTVVALLVAGRRGFVVHVGDSRAYLLREEGAVPLTRDHSVLNELLQRGEISHASAGAAFAGFRHSLSRAVGVCQDVEVDATDFEVLPGDVYVLASDGLTQYVRADELSKLVAAPSEDVAASLIALANERGGDDNITAVVVRVDVDSLDPAGDAARGREFATKISAFRGLPLFRHLHYAELIRVLAATEVLETSAGEVVLKEGEDGDAMYVVLEGRVGLSKSGATVAEFKAGSHFGEVSLVECAPRAATATVLDAGRLLRLRREHLYALVQREPELAVKLLWSFAETLDERVRVPPQATADVRPVEEEPALERA
jgi:serine/threonine protein phosphatase PrpC